MQAAGWARRGGAEAAAPGGAGPRGRRRALRRCWLASPVSGRRGAQPGPGPSRAPSRPREERRARGRARSNPPGRATGTGPAAPGLRRPPSEDRARQRAEPRRRDMHRAGGGRRGLRARAQRPFPPVSGGRRAGGANFAANLGLGSGAAQARTTETDAGRLGESGGRREPEEGAAGGPGPLGTEPGVWSRAGGDEVRKRSPGNRSAADSRKGRGRGAQDVRLLGRRALRLLISPAPPHRRAGGAAGTRRLGCKAPQLLLLEARGRVGERGRELGSWLGSARTKGVGEGTEQRARKGAVGGSAARPLLPEVC